MPSGAHDGEFDAWLDMHGMVQDAFQQRDEPHVPVPPLEDQFGDIVMDAFNIVDKLETVLDDESNDGADYKPIEDNEQQIFEEENLDDARVLEEAMEELYHGARSFLLATTLLIITLCTVHGVSNKFVGQLFT
jgi:hypothetical protein